ncbi:MAG TPA: nucleotidyltransferase family protein [Terriglobales bacterium]|jgi:NDP-sugar pyrophosphorylase family protein|nr:nucleotidyltransferase family protein [Terriglobales bacterium]
MRASRALTVNPQANTQVRLEAGIDVPAVLLVGGMGTRLQAVLPSTPKPLALVGDAPFLELLLLQLRGQGIRRLVMCTGHLSEQIEEQFGDGRKWDVGIEYSKETQPLGTAGAVKFAERYLAQASDFLVMNGDSFLEMDFRQLIRFHRGHGSLVSMAVRRVPDAARYGTVQVGTRNRIIGFVEKTGAQAPGVINGGVYVFNRAVLQSIPNGPASLEKDVFPHLLEQQMCAVEQDGMFIDIGTPEDYARAQALCRSLQEAAHAGPR